jgi:hypothetical protein
LINKLENVHIEAARIVTGGTRLVSINSLYKETGWETLQGTYWGDTYGLSSVVVMNIFKVTGNNCTKVRRNKTVYHYIKIYFFVIFPSCL